MRCRETCRHGRQHVKHCMKGCLQKWGPGAGPDALWLANLICSRTFMAVGPNSLLLYGSFLCFMVAHILNIYGTVFCQARHFITLTIRCNYDCCWGVGMYNGCTSSCHPFYLHRKKREVKCELITFHCGNSRGTWAYNATCTWIQNSSLIHQDVQCDL